MTGESVTTEAEYLDALKEIEGLMMAAPGTAEGERLTHLVTLVEEYEQKAVSPTLDSLLKNSPRHALSLTQEDREWLHHTLPSESGGPWDGWFKAPGTSPDFLEDRDQPDDEHNNEQS